MAQFAEDSGLFGWFVHFFKGSLVGVGVADGSQMNSWLVTAWREINKYITQWIASKFVCC